MKLPTKKASYRSALRWILALRLFSLDLSVVSTFFIIWFSTFPHFGSHFYISAHIFTFQLVFTFRLMFSHFSSYFHVSARVFTFQLAFSHFSSRFHISDCIFHNANMEPYSKYSYNSEFLWGSVWLAAVGIRFWTVANNLPGAFWKKSIFWYDVIHPLWCKTKKMHFFWFWSNESCISAWETTWRLQMNAKC